MKMESGRRETGGGDLHWWVLTVTPVFTAIAVPCLVLSDIVYPFFLLRDSFMENGEGKLGRVLKEAAMEDNTVIITTLNEAWATPGSIFDLFLESFQIGNQTRHLLNHLVVVALDKKAYNRCLAVHPHCFYLTTEEDFSGGEKYFMSPVYLMMMWRRILFLRFVLQLGYNFVFTDVDIMWLRDPFPRFNKDADFQISCDRFNGNSLDSRNDPNRGFVYVKSNKRTIKFYKFWYLSRYIHPGRHDQDVLNRIKRQPFTTLIGLKMRFLTTTYFGGFCETSKDLNQGVLVWTEKFMISKLCSRIGESIVSLPMAVKRSNPSSWRVPQLCLETFGHPPLKRGVQKGRERPDKFPYSL